MENVSNLRGLQRQTCACSLSHSPSVSVCVCCACVSSCSWETVCCWDRAVIWNGQEKEDQIRENRGKKGRSWHVVSRGVTWSTKLIRVVKESKRKEEKERGGARLDRHRHEHIFQFQIIRFPQVVDMLKQTTHIHMHTHTDICTLTGIQVHNHLVTDANSGTHAETQTVW